MRARGCEVSARAECGPRWKSSQGGSCVDWAVPMGKAWRGVCPLMLFAGPANGWLPSREWVLT